MRRLLIPLLALFGLLAAGCIIQFATRYVDDDGRTHFVGLATNLTGADVVDAIVEVRFYDSSNNLLATRFVNPCTRTLQAHQASPVEAVIPVGVTVKRTETVVHPLTFGEKMVPDLDFKNVAVEVDDDVTHLVGEVKNSDNVTFYSVQVCAAFYDDDGDVLRVGQDFTAPAKLSKGATTEFDIAVEDMPSDVEEYQIWVDATVRTPTDVTAPVVEGPEEMPTALENTGWLDASANAAEDGDGFEVDPDNAYENDADSATNADNSGEPGDSHLYYDYGVDIPDDADIEGIGVRLDWFLDSADGDNSIDVELSWDGGTTWTDAKSDDEETTDEHDVILGGGSDTWGRDWEVDELSNDNFRVKVICNSSGTRTFYLEWVPIKIYYTE